MKKAILKRLRSVIGNPAIAFEFAGKRLALEGNQQHF
jgi:hypothetical protein